MALILSPTKNIIKRTKGKDLSVFENTGATLYMICFEELDACIMCYL